MNKMDKQQRSGLRMRRSDSASKSSTINFFHITIVFLIGLYLGVNLSQVPASLPDSFDSESNAPPQVLVTPPKCEQEQSVPQSTQHHEISVPKNPNLHPVCQKLPFPTPSALTLWHQHLLPILDATRIPKDLKYDFRDFTLQLLQIISPRLQQSVRSIPRDWSSVERVMTVLHDRYQYIQMSAAEQAEVTTPPRPLRVLVMGGSLLVGTNCRKLKTELKIDFLLPNRECNWSKRLEFFLNAFAGGDLVEVTKVAMGGTNTATGNVIWEYDLIPDEAKSPDIVINAYSTNDMHILTILEAQSANVTLRDKVFDTIQQFVRTLLNTCDSQTPPPLLLHVDDYLGNEQRKIWDTTELSQGVQVLANYYGFASYSYADVVRDIVYGDTRESWFSANWWLTGKFEREIHPGMGMHITSVWVTVYNVLHMVTTYCSIPPIPDNYSLAEYQPGVLGLPPLQGSVKQAPNKPKNRPKGLPPILTKELLIEDVSRLWEEQSKSQPLCDSGTDRLDSSSGGDKRLSKCPFSWVSGLSLQQNNQTWISEYFQKQATVFDGWKLIADGEKLGFVPEFSTMTKGSEPRVVLEFMYPQTIRSVTLFFMKSYGTKWENSRLHLRIWKDSSSESLLAESIVEGIHNKNTSEMYTEAMVLSESVSMGSKVVVEATLAGGQMFKIMGLAVCR